MKKYIDQEAAIKAVQTVPAGNWSNKRYVQEISSVPTEDVVEVVRCKECKYAPSGTDDGEEQGFGLEWPYDKGYDINPCPLKCNDGWYSRKPKPEWFCWEGERKNETTDL